MKKFKGARLGALAAKVGGGPKKGSDEAFEEQRARFDHMTTLLTGIEKDLRRNQKVENFSEPLSQLAASFVTFFDEGEGGEGVDHGGAFKTVAEEVATAFAEYARHQQELLDIVQAYHARWNSLKAKIADRDKLFGAYESSRKTHEQYSAKPPKDTVKQDQASQKFESSKALFEQTNEALVDEIKLLWHHRFDEFDGAFTRLSSIQFDLFNKIASSYAGLEGAKASTASHPTSSETVVVGPTGDMLKTTKTSAAVAGLSTGADEHEFAATIDPEEAAATLAVATAALASLRADEIDATQALEATEEELSAAVKAEEEAATAHKLAAASLDAALGDALKEHDARRQELERQVTNAEKALNEATEANETAVTISAGTTSSGLFKMKAEFSFEKTEDGEVSFQEGDVLTVLQQFDDSEWWQGLNERSGEKGLFPSNYAERLPEEPAASKELPHDEAALNVLKERVTSARAALDILERPEGPADLREALAAAEASVALNTSSRKKAQTVCETTRERLAAVAAAVQDALKTVNECSERKARADSFVARRKAEERARAEREAEELARAEREAEELARAEREAEEEAQRERKRAEAAAAAAAKEKAEAEKAEAEKEKVKAEAEAKAQADIVAQAAVKSSAETAADVKNEALQASADAKAASTKDRTDSKGSERENPGTVNSPEVRVADFEFEGTEDGELPFAEGDAIEVVEVVSGSEWWQGKNLRTGKIGLFPSNYTSVQSKPLEQTLSPAESSLPVETPPSAASKPQNEVISVSQQREEEETDFAPSEAAIAPVVETVADTSPVKERMRAEFDFEGTEPGELPFNEGDIIIVLEKPADNDWWTGRNERTDANGLFPSNYCSPV